MSNQTVLPISLSLACVGTTCAGIDVGFTIDGFLCATVIHLEHLGPYGAHRCEELADLRLDSGSYHHTWQESAVRGMQTAPRPAFVDMFWCENQ